MELTFEKTDRGPIKFFASYVLSEAHGNYPGVANTDLRNNGGNANWSYDLPEQLINGTGALPNDRRHVFKLFGSYRFDFGLTAGTSFNGQSGSPLSEYGTGVLGPPYWTFLRQRGTAGNMPTLWDLSFRFTYDLRQRLGMPIRPRLILDLFHVLNQRTVVDVGLEAACGQGANETSFGVSISTREA